MSKRPSIVLHEKKGKIDDSFFLSTFLFLSTIFVYLFIICYSEEFFRWFSYPYERLPMPLNFYLQNLLDISFWNLAFYILMALFISFLCIFYIYLAKLPSEHLPKFVLFCILFLMVGLYTFQKEILENIIELSYFMHNYQNELIFYVCLSICIWIYSYIYFKRYYYMKIFKNKLRAWKIAKYYIKLFVLFFLISFIFFNDCIIVKFGANDAINLIEGKPLTYDNDHGRFELKLLLNDSELDFSNKTLIFFTQYDGNYYFIEKQAKATKSVPIYAVPIGKVKLANITRV